MVKYEALNNKTYEYQIHEFFYVDDANFKKFWKALDMFVNKWGANAGDENEEYPKEGCQVNLALAYIEDKNKFTVAWKKFEKEWDGDINGSENFWVKD